LSKAGSSWAERASEQSRKIRRMRLMITGASADWSDHRARKRTAMNLEHAVAVAPVGSGSAASSKFRLRSTTGGNAALVWDIGRATKDHVSGTLVSASGSWTGKHARRNLLARAVAIGSGEQTTRPAELRVGKRSPGHIWVRRSTEFSKMADIYMGRCRSRRSSGGARTQIQRGM
jgi:hypothetical protein